MTFVALTNPEVAAKAPMDDTLWGKVQEDLNDLNSRVIAAGAAPFVFEVQGKLSKLANYKRSIASGVVNKEFIPTLCRYMLKQSSSVPFTFDIRTHTSLKIPITGISHQYTAATSSISRQGAGLSTQSITRATAQISTQSITFAKASANIQSITLLGSLNIGGTTQDNCVLYDLDVAPDADTVPGDYFLIASATTGANNGTFSIVDVNRGGGKNIVVVNSSGVAQAGAAGTAQAQILSYNFTNPVDTMFTTGIFVHTNGHTSALNDGDFAVFKINQSGNNLWVKNSAGVAQGGVAGTADTAAMKFNMASAVSTTDYIVGELAATSGHTAPANNSSFLPIVGVNIGGNNLVLSVFGGATQGGAAGTVNTNRWVYNLPTDPSAQVSAGDTMYMLGHTSAFNDGVFIIRAVTSSTITVANPSGVAQVGAAGNVYTTKKLIKFAADQSANFTLFSYVEMQNTNDILYNAHFSIAPFRVLEINRGGGANYNIVIDNPKGTATGAGGNVQTEMKSIFNAQPSLAASLTGSAEPNQNIVGSSIDFVGAVIPANTPIMLYVTAASLFYNPRDLSVVLT